MTAAVIVGASALVTFASLWWAQCELDGLYAMRLREKADLKALRKEAEQPPKPPGRRPQGQRAPTKP